MPLIDVTVIASTGVGALGAGIVDATASFLLKEAMEW